MDVTEFQFVSAGCRCSGLYYLPNGWCRPTKLPTIVVVPGGMGIMSTPRGEDCGRGLPELAKSFAQDGFLACSYNGRGQGDSEGARSGHNLAVEDLAAALTYLRDECDAADGRRIGLFGQSVGGMAAVLTAARDDGIKSLILWGTLPRYSVWKQKQQLGGDGTMEVLWQRASKEEDWKGKSIEDFVREFQTFDPIDLIGKLSQPILLAGGSEDKEYFHADEQSDFFEAANSKRVMFLKVKGEPHRIRHGSPSFPILAKLLSAWFRETL